MIPCPSCGKKDSLQWDYFIVGPTGIAQGRYHTNELSVQVLLGCRHCSETLEVMDLDEFLRGVEPRPRSGSSVVTS